MVHYEYRYLYGYQNDVQTERVLQGDGVGLNTTISSTFIDELAATKIKASNERLRRCLAKNPEYRQRLSG